MKSQFACETFYGFISSWNVELKSFEMHSFVIAHTTISIVKISKRKTNLVNLFFYTYVWDICICHTMMEWEKKMHTRPLAECMNQWLVRVTLQFEAIQLYGLIQSNIQRNKKKHYFFFFWFRGFVMENLYLKNQWHGALNKLPMFFDVYKSILLDFNIYPSSAISLNCLIATTTKFGGNSNLFPNGLFFCISFGETRNQPRILTGQWKMIHFGNEIKSQKIDSTNDSQTNGTFYLVRFALFSMLKPNGFLSIFCYLITFVFYRIMASHCTIFRCKWKTKFQQWRQFTSALSAPSFEYFGYKKINIKMKQETTENTNSLNYTLFIPCEIKW